MSKIRQPESLPNRLKLGGGVESTLLNTKFECRIAGPTGSASRDRFVSNIRQTGKLPDRLKLRGGVESTSLNNPGATTHCGSPRKGPKHGKMSEWGRNRYSCNAKPSRSHRFQIRCTSQYGTTAESDVHPQSKTSPFDALRSLRRPIIIVIYYFF